tara:strand:- start:3073 stop:5433 length:2361 start_codon:yes stop_codon:yes gene_type:complete
MATKTSTQYVEYANPEIIDILCAMDYGQFQKINDKFYNPADEFKRDLLNKHDEDSHAQQFTRIKKLCAKFKKGNYSILTKYNRRGRKECRQYAEHESLQGIWAIYRNAMVHTDSYDIDMVNAHPTIILSLCEKYDISCKHLKRYVNERDEIIAEFDEADNISEFVGDNLRSYIKTELFISSINYDKERTTFPKHSRKKKIVYDFWKKFNTEILEIQKRFIGIFRDEIAILKKDHSYNLGGRIMSYIGCKYEDILLSKIEENGITPSVKMYDGFLINSNHFDLPELLFRCNEQTKDFGVKWSMKDIKRDIIPLLRALDISNNSDVNIIRDTTYEVAVELLNSVYKDRLFKCNETHFLKSKRGWLQTKESIVSELINEITDLQIYVSTPKNGDVFIANRLNWVNETVTYMLSKCPVNDGLMNEIWEKTIRKIYFKNGYYDFNTLTFEKNDMNSFEKVSRDLSFESNPVIRAEIYSKVLHPIFSIDGENDEERIQLMRHWLHKMSRVMAGYVEDKEAICGEGNRNCGKGVLSDMLGFAFGGYVGASNAENFILKNRNDEEAKKNSFMHDWQFKRLIVCNEVSFKEYGATVFDGNLIKKAHSGGDFIEMRQLYVNKTNVRLQATVLFNLNDLPKFNPADAREKLVLYNFNSKFVKTPLSDAEKFSNIKYYQAVDSVKTEFIKRDDVGNEFVLMLIEAFQTDAVYPQALLDEQNEDLEDDNDINGVLDLFDITRCDSDRITNKELKEFIALKKIRFSFAKITKLLCGKRCKRGRDGGNRFISGLVIKSLPD